MFKAVFSFKGRIGRTEYALTVLFYIVSLEVIDRIGKLGNHAVLIYYFYFPLIWLWLSQGTKRCHDIGKRGSWLIVPTFIYWMIVRKGNQQFDKE